MAETHPGNGKPLISGLAKSLATRLDGWMNVLVGLGDATRDKQESAEHVPGVPLDPQQLDALYRDDDTAARICDTVPNEMLRKGFGITIQPGEDNKEMAAAAQETEAAILTAAEELDVITTFIEAMTWGRLFGGGAIFVGADDGAADMSLPLNEENIKTIKSLAVLYKRYLTVQEWYGDPMEKLFGKPKIYNMQPSVNSPEGIEQVFVHHTRLIVFLGTRPTIEQRIELQGWSDSVLDRVDTVLRDYNMGWKAVTHLLQDASQAVFKIKNLIQQIAANNTSAILTRLRLVDMNRSIARAIAIDADGETFERQPYNFGGVHEILDKLMLRMASAARMPVTILMGQSPAGMDATGDSDTRWFYDTIASDRQTELTPKLRHLLKIVMLAKDGPTGGKLPENWAIQYPSLWEPTPKEESEVRKNTAEQDKTYIETGVATAEEIALSRFKPSGWSMETTIDLELRKEIQAADREAALAGGKPAPDPDPDPNAPE